MKRLLVTLSVFLAAGVWGLALADSNTSCQTDADCSHTGWGGQLCASEDIVGCGQPIVAPANDSPAGLERTVDPAQVLGNVAPSQGCELEKSDATVDSLEGDAGPRSKPKGCKACPDQPWCPCTYNGQPRISCDPCCYQTYTGEICLS